MAGVELHMSIIESPLTRPIIEGRAEVEGARVDAHAALSVNTNSMEMLDLKFDVAEMSLATFTKAREQGVPLVALPLFTGRRFLHSGVSVASGSAIRDPADLRGHRVGLPQFWMTSSVWHRLILRQVYGVAQNEVHWVTTARERMGSLGLPPEAKLDASGRNAQALLLAGEVDAVMAAGGAGAARGEGGGEPDDRVVPIFHDPIAAQRAYYEGTGIFPIMHLIAMKEELATSEPELVGHLCDAFRRGKEMALEEAMSDPSDRPIPGLGESETRALFGDDPWPYGIGPNRTVLELFLNDALDQGLTDRKLGVEELFPAQLPASYR